MELRRREDEAFASFVGIEIVSLRLPDAVFRGYVGGPQLFGWPRLDDPEPITVLRAALAGLRVDELYVPFAIGGHVDHRQTRRAAVALLAEAGSLYAGRVTFYEDFPYAMTVGFEGLDQLDAEVLPSLPPAASLTPEYVEIGAVLDRKIAGLGAYESQIDHLFGEDGESVAGAIHAHTARIGRLGGFGRAERYWRIGGGHAHRPTAAHPPRLAT